MKKRRDIMSRRMVAGFSLLRLSALARLGGALVVITALWIAAFWALH